MWNNYTDVSSWRGVNDYQRAFERWQKAPQWRNDAKSDFAPRKVEVNSSKRKWSIRLLKTDGGIACRYWEMDVVTFNPDNSITLNPWRGMSTDAFANALTPSGISTHFNDGHGMLVSCDWNGDPRYGEDRQRIYDLRGGAVTFEKRDDGAWWPRDPEKTTDVIEVARVNRKRARAALLKHDLKRFERWAQTAVMMRLGQDVDWDRGSRADDGDMVDALDDRERWIELIKLRRFWPDTDERRLCFGRPVRTYYSRADTRFGSGGWSRVEPLSPVEQGDRFVKRLVKALRMAVYTAERAIDVETIPYYTSWAQVADVAQRHSRFYDAIQSARRGW